MRPPFKLVVPPFPLVKMDTRPTDRPLDVNDHIINFLESIPVTETVTLDKEVDDKLVTVTRTRPAYASEVLRDPELRQKFNDYMKAHGQKVSINFQGGVSPWNRPAVGAIRAATTMFMTAYQEKGWCPRPGSIPASTPVETLAYRIRNFEYTFPEDAKRDWPRFDLNAHWPVQAWALDAMPLREREFIWKRFRDLGKTHSYGPYTKHG